ncbi:LysR family transcriptional regulator [Bifidobacterium miconisargentati]|uniref:LysR family transcriptional regulator n=1 Tax=Bifidobacterium miconisargentati TaxID=2834437 RepID=UPI001BDC3321|nr:LysR family transcriptional regulator [Bifidobacterium miconisargentati]MBW3089985.1 LysR family transcriptional regulator [Bifidobacterium miconisargentati]
MYDRRLDAVIAAARTGSFAKAGRLLHISTPAVAKQVTTFEKEYGLTLFDRSRSGVTPTRAGREFVEDAQMIVRQCEEILRRTRQLTTASSASVRLGVSTLRPGRRILDLWQRDAGRHTDIRLELVSMPDDSETINDIVTHLGEDIDMISTAFDAGYWDDTCSTLALDSEPLCVAVPRSHALAKRARLALDDLEGTRIRILKRHRGANDTARDILERHPAIDLIDIDHYDLDTFNDCAESGDLLISKPMWDGIHPQFVNVAVDWPEPVVMHYGLLYPIDPSPAIHTFVTRIDELASSAQSAIHAHT